MNEEERTWKKGTSVSIETYKDKDGKTLVPMSLELMRELNQSLKESNKLKVALFIMLGLILVFLVVVALRFELWTRIGVKIFCG